MSQLHNYAGRAYYSIRDNCFGKCAPTFASINAFALNCTIKVAVSDQKRVAIHMLYSVRDTRFGIIIHHA
jgi:hypothetical protein